MQSIYLSVGRLARRFRPAHRLASAEQPTDDMIYMSQMFAMAQRLFHPKPT